MKDGTFTQEERLGHWVKAREEAYYPTIWEKICHFFGKHVYPYQEPFTCLMCGRKDSNL